jgi:hypothetical protein
VAGIRQVLLIVGWSLSVSRPTSGPCVVEVAGDLDALIVPPRPNPEGPARARETSFN